MSQRAFTSAANRYARTWVEREEDLALGLRAIDRATRLGSLQRCAGYFRIARNFPTRFDLDRELPRLDPVLAILDTLRFPLRSDHLIDIVERTSERLASVYGKKGLLSAATKLLWLMHKDPVVIYDSQVRASLRVPPGNYAAYVSRWHALYSQHAAGIRRATSRIGVPGAPVEGEWFRRRVFDLYLWAEGVPS